MATLKTNTLTGTSTAGSIAVTGEGNSTTTNLQQGLCKAWAGCQTSGDGGGDPTIVDSFNHASLTDNGTGDYTTSFSNAFGSANYVSCAVPSRGLGDTSLSANVHTRAASSYRCECSRDNSTKTDAANYSSSHFGDLA